MDHLTAGRAGWLVATSAQPEAARAWGRPRVPTASLAREARDVVTVVSDLWDSWDDDAVIRDVASGRYLDRDRLHYVDFTGETFAVKGPAIVPRPPQGRPVLFAAPGLLDADVALVDTPVRVPGAARTFVEIEVALDTPDDTAAERVAQLGGWPDTGRSRYTGPAAGLVEALTDLHGAVDGVRLHPLVLDDDLAVLSRLVIPALLRTGVAARPLPGTTLRATLGLPRPVSRFAAGHSTCTSAPRSAAAPTRRTGFQAGDSADGRDFAARNADVIFSAHGTDFADALAFATDIRTRLRAAGRPADDIRILPGTEIVIGDTEQEARDKLRWVRHGQVTPRTALTLAGLVWNRDLSDRDPDGPLPAEDPVVADNDGSFGSRRIEDAPSVAQEWREQAEANGWSLREAVIALGPQRGHVGTPSSLADRFAHFVRHGAVDGFNVSPYLIPDGLDDIVDKLVPALQERGVYRTAYTGTTLREHLDLRAPLTRREVDRRSAG